MVWWFGSVREGAKSSMFALQLQRMIATGRPSFILQPSPPCCSAVGAARQSTQRSPFRSFVRPTEATLVPQVRHFSSGGLCRTVGLRISSFLGGDSSLMSTAGGMAKVSGKPSKGVRMMGGGPRTFPGGVTKWQWKRMQEKRERQIEKARLLRERQAFEERQRQKLLAASPQVEKPWEQPVFRSPQSPPLGAFDPQVRALADRFRKDQGEDLWNDADGPVASNGLPSLVTARFNPKLSTRSSFSNGGPSLDGRLGARVSVRSKIKASSNDVSHGNQSVQEYSSPPKISLTNFDRNLGGNTERYRSRRGMPDGLGGQDGASADQREKSGNLSPSRKFSSTSTSAFLDDFEEEGTSIRDKKFKGQRNVNSDMSRMQLMSSAPSKRFAEHPESELTEIRSQQRKKVRQVLPVDKVASDVSTEALLTHLSETRFDSFQISALSVRALHEVMGYERMTMVQEATFPLILEGKDVLAKAKTGTGKTIAFLLPSIEAILKAKSSRNGGLLRRSPINVLIICPTRELAIQAATEAKSLMTYHNGMDAQVVIGGTNVSTEANNLQKRHCQVLVATPGRLLDHMSSVEFRQQLHHLKVLVLDEADRLLDMGFRRDLEKIIKMLPENRQTLLFSATIPDEVHKVSEIAMRKNHVFVDTVGKNTEDTHAKVQQLYAIVPLEDQLSAVYSLLQNHIEEEEDYKVLVFCTTAKYTALMAELSTKLGLNTLEIHSRKSQAYRTRVSDVFRKSLGVIMYTSDVSARGVDYPDVTLVIQLGIPAGREDYVHRLGRTGRAGKEGKGVLILAPWEKGFLRALKDIPITEYVDLKISDDAEDQVFRALDIVKLDTKEKAYAAWLGYYNSAKMLPLSKTELVRLANSFSSTLGMDEPPALMKKTIGMMGLKGVPGLRIA